MESDELVRSLASLRRVATEEAATAGSWTATAVDRGLLRAAGNRGLSATEAAQALQRDQTLLERTGTVLDRTLRQVRRAEREAGPSTSVLRAADKLTPSGLPAAGVVAPAGQEVRLAQLVDRMAPESEARLFELAVDCARRSVASSAGLKNVAGLLRELAAWCHPDLERLVVPLKAQLRALVREGSNLFVFDSRDWGDVWLRTSNAVRRSEQAKTAGTAVASSAAAAGREGLGLRLGTDRVIGMARLMTPGEQAELGFRCAGVIRIKALIEVKGEKVAEGFEQLREFVTRGKPGFAVIDNQLWLLEYEPHSVLHVVVGLRGGGTRVTAGLQEVSTALGPARFVELSSELDGQIKNTARALLRDAAAEVRRAPTAR